MTTMPTNVFTRTCVCICVNLQTPVLTHKYTYAQHMCKSVAMFSEMFVCGRAIDIHTTRTFAFRFASYWCRYWCRCQCWYQCWWFWWLLYRCIVKKCSISTPSLLKTTSLPTFADIWLQIPTRTQIPGYPLQDPLSGPLGHHKKEQESASFTPFGFGIVLPATLVCNASLSFVHSGLICNKKWTNIYNQSKNF